MASVIPYFDVEGNLPESIASLKIIEAITILREIDKSIDIILANFDDPGKIDLINFMEKFDVQYVSRKIRLINDNANNNEF